MNLSILARQTIAALGGILAHHGVVADTNSTVSIVGGVLVVGISLIWSLIEKVEMNDETKDVVKKFSGALASQLVASLAGWLQADAATAADPAALLLFMGNATLSHVRGHVPPAKLLLMILPFMILSCSNVAQDALKKRAEEAALEVGKQAAIVAAEGTLNWLRKELKTLEAKPIDQNRISALKAAIKSGEEQLVKLRAPSAKQPVVVQRIDKNMTDKKIEIPTADLFLSDIFLSQTSPKYHVLTRTGSTVTTTEH